jgi:hypothetical protein
LIYQCLAYLFPDGRVMVHGDYMTDNLDRWLNPEEKERATKVVLRIEVDDDSKVMGGEVVNL